MKTFVLALVATLLAWNPVQAASTINVQDYVQSVSTFPASCGETIVINRSVKTGEVTLGAMLQAQPMGSEYLEDIPNSLVDHAYCTVAGPVNLTLEMSRGIVPLGSPSCEVVAPPIRLIDLPDGKYTITYVIYYLAQAPLPIAGNVAYARQFRVVKTTLLVTSAKTVVPPPPILPLPK